MIECDSFGRNLQQFFTIRHCLLGTLFYALSSLFCSFFFSFIFYAFMYLFVPMGPRSSRLNIFFGIQLPYRCEKERNHVQCSFFFFYCSPLVVVICRQTFVFVIVLRCTCFPHASCSIYVRVSLHLYPLMGVKPVQTANRWLILLSFMHI